jgi:apolipoprotein D and lipocalin family protein
MRLAGCAAALGLSVSIASAAPAGAAAPSPAKAVELSRYVGRWYELARVPNQFEKGRQCDAPTADYQQSPDGAVTVVQTCHVNSPTGPARTYKAAAQILDPGTNAKFRLTFFLLLSREYWVVDHAVDYRWAIVGDPSGKYVWLLSRQPQLSPPARSALVARARQLGYDIGRLEFPDPATG